jgi:hypothetical protein
MKPLQLTILALLMLVVILLLSACSPSPDSTGQTVSADALEPESEESIDVQSPESSQDTLDPARTGSGWPDGQVQQDIQGAVEVVIKPLNLNNPGETLDFEVTLDTHSVDLSMDLAGLATLTTDTGQTIQASRWDAPSGGHHVSGVLSFPASLEGSALLEGASRLTVTLVNLDVPQRVLAWSLALDS